MAHPLAPKWRVTSQQETRRPTATGQFVSGVIVGFTTASGVSGSVFVPDADYTTERVKALIAARVAQLESVQQLTG